MLLVADAARVVRQDEYLERRKSLGAELLDLRLLKYSIETQIGGKRPCNKAARGAKRAHC